MTTDSKVSLRPLIESALHTESKALALGLRRTRERLTEFEQRFGMTAPHHKHLAEGVPPQPTTPPDLASVLKEIELSMEAGQSH